MATTMNDLFTWLTDWDDDGPAGPHAFPDSVRQHFSNFFHEPKASEEWENVWDTANGTHSRAKRDMSPGFPPKKSFDSIRKHKDSDDWEGGTLDAKISRSSPTGKQSSISVINSTPKEASQKATSRLSQTKGKHKGALREKRMVKKTNEKKEKIDVGPEEERIPGSKIAPQQSRWVICVPCWGSGGTKCGCGADPPREDLPPCVSCKGTGLMHCSRCLGWGGISVPS
jgi:hypothetical protein